LDPNKKTHEQKRKKHDNSSTSFHSIRWIELGKIVQETPQSLYTCLHHQIQGLQPIVGMLPSGNQTWHHGNFPASHVWLAEIIPTSNSTNIIWYIYIYVHI
jgi:hypothetical protein